MLSAEEEDCAAIRVFTGQRSRFCKIILCRPTSQINQLRQPQCEPQTAFVTG